MPVKSPLLLPLLAALSFSFVNPCSQKIAQPVKQPMQGDEVFEVEVIYPEFLSTPRAQKVDGAVEESEIRFVTANVEGEVEQVFVREGDRVNEGDPVFSVANAEVAERLELKRAKAKEVAARLKSAKNSVAVAPKPDRPVTNDEVLFLDEGFADEPPTAHKRFGIGEGPEPPQTLKDLVEVLEALTERYNAEAVLLEGKMQELTHKAAVSGTVLEVFFNEGNKVKEQDKVVAIARTDPAGVSFELPKDVASFVDKHSRVSVALAEDSSISGEGNVSFIAPDIDPVAGTIRLKALVANPDDRMKGGQRARVNVETTKMDRALVLPEKAVVYQADKRFVFVVYGNQARLVEVTVGRKLEDGRVEVEGLDVRVEDPIVVNRPVELKNNSFVRVVEKPETTEEARAEGL